MSNEREEGIVKMYNVERGFGFITRRTGSDIYVHRTVVERAGLESLIVGERISFVAKQTERGWQAENIQRIGMSTQSQSTPLRLPSQISSFSRPETSTNFKFGPEYLRDGYFVEKEGKHYLRPEIIDSLAIDAAKVLGNAGMKSSQLRRFFNKVRGIEARLDLEKDFEAIKIDIYSLKRDVAYQVGRRIVPEEFQYFINRNVELSVQSKECFQQGFLQHFESLLAYFVYLFRE